MSPRSVIGALACISVVSCGSKGPTAAATQPTPAAFDPASSDPEAVKLVDGVVAGLGGDAAWARVKELSFSVTYLDGDTTMARFEHVWDRWNGRHHFAARTQGADGATHLQEVKHDLFDASAKPWVALDGAEGGTAEQRAEIVSIARQRLKEDAYFLAFLYKLKDPGVKLTIDNLEITVEGSGVCQPSCTSVMVSFDPGVGTDRWNVNINNETKQPQVIEKVTDAGRIGYELAGWTDAGGLRWPTRFQNLGLPSEVIVYSDVAVR
jgi:hypothetical protein